eukprot:564090-Pyramimonas_sp.AAC.1
MGKKRRHHSQTAEKTWERGQKRLEVEYERAHRTCSCPPWEPHSEACRGQVRLTTGLVFKEEPEPSPSPPRSATPDWGRSPTPPPDASWTNMRKRWRLRVHTT